jgi:Holliday junction resolvase-like predicted endonuclease
MRPQQAFLIEALVFQALQNEFRGSIRKNVRLPNGQEIDGIIETTDGAIIGVEVKFIGIANRNVADVFYRLEKQVIRIAAALSSSEYPTRPKIVVALVFDQDPHKILEKYRKSIEAKAELRLYSLADLYRDYGFPAESAS